MQSEWTVADGAPARRYFALTPAGRQVLAEGRDGWSSFADRMTRALEV